MTLRQVFALVSGSEKTEKREKWLRGSPRMRELMRRYEGYDGK